MRKFHHRNSILVAGLILMTLGSYAQRISFGTWAADGIVLTKGTPGELNFNDKTQVINPGVNQVVTIGLHETQAAVIAIEGVEYLDVTVYVDAPATLDLDPSNSVPLNIRFAYSNLGAPDVSVAKNQAIEVPSGFNTATFPILRRTSGPPGPPPTPVAGSPAPRNTAYLFVYGSLGPVGWVDAGHYDGQINITVVYSTYE